MLPSPPSTAYRAAVAGTGDERLMRRALDLAVESASTGGGPFGALLVRGGDVVATGTNLVTSTCDPTAHAEIVAIRRAGEALRTFDLSGSALYASCEPCPMCYTAALWARVDAVFFAGTRDDAAAAGFDDRRFHDELTREPALRSLPLVPLLRESARDPFDAWAANPDRVSY